MEFAVCDDKRFLWEAVDNHVVEEETDHNEIGPKGFYFDFFDEDNKWGR